MRKRRQPDHIYVMGHQRGGAVKVGISFKPQARRTHVQHKQGEPIVLFWQAKVERAQSVEKIAHHLLSANRISGEWFEVSPEAAADVVKVAIKMDEDYDAAVTAWAMAGGTAPLPRYPPPSVCPAAKPGIS